MLATPNENDRPIVTAKVINEFYFQESPKIFPEEPEQGNQFLQM